eukprot:3284829-Amphidinium_carterae.1
MISLESAGRYVSFVELMSEGRSKAFGAVACKCKLASTTRFYAFRKEQELSVTQFYGAGGMMLMADFACYGEFPACYCRTCPSSPCEENVRSTQSLAQTY